MTKEAVRILLEWASDTDKGTQAAFAEYYEKHREAYAFDESLGARFESAPTVFNANMMRRMIETFGEAQRDEKKRWG